MNEIFLSDITNAKKIRILCPYCGKYHDMICKGNEEGDDDSPYEVEMKCNDLDYIWQEDDKLTLYLWMFIIYEEDEKVTKLHFCMNYPCYFLWNIEPEFDIHISEFETETNSKIMTLKTIKKIEAIDEFLKYDRDFSEYKNDVFNGCMGIEDKCLEVCKYCCQSGAEYKKDNIYEMQIQIELQLEIKKEKRTRKKNFK